MFITFEGPEGSGKTTQLPALTESLRQEGFPVLATREPGGTSIGDQVRTVLFNLENTAMQPSTEILLFLASRAQLVAEVIRPSLEAGKVVLCDRYADSTIAYQGYGHQVDLEELRVMINFATDGLKPDLTLLLDVEVEAGIKRRTSGGSWNRLDAYELEFHQRVREGYHQMVAAEPDRWVVIDASRSFADVQNDIKDVVLSRLKQAG